MNEEPSFQDTGFYINNAGMVLLQPYIPMLFDRLGLTKENVFINHESQLRAVHYLQFLVTNQSQTEEHHLVLNKILCGLEFTTSIPNGIEINPGEETLMEGLLQALINQWSALGAISIESLRETFLLREGKLIENGNSLELTVEQKTYDILIDRLPYSYSTIKYPWMNKPFNVIWR